MSDTNLTAEEASARAMELRATYFRLMGVQNTPRVVMVDGEYQYVDDFPDDPELDARVAGAWEKLDAFMTEHREILRGTEFAQVWGPLELAGPDQARFAPDGIAQGQALPPDAPAGAHLRQTLDRTEQGPDLPPPGSARGLAARLDRLERSTINHQGSEPSGPGIEL